MSDSDHENQELAAIICVDHAVATDPETPQALPLGGELLSLQRLLAESLDRLHDPLLCVPREGLELLDGTALPANRGRGRA